MFLKALRFFVLCLVIFIGGCDIDVYTEEPERPINIPESSLWVGGADGGVFVFIKPPEKSDKTLYYAEIYYGSGDAAYKGFMRVYPDNHGDFDINKKESYVAWDGDNLYLRNDRYLKVQE